MNAGTEDGAPRDGSGAVVAETGLRCPRCGYNLTGLHLPRCPECGLALDAAQLAAGFARENIATRLDRCDPWQPHQVLIASLLELLHNAMRPGRVLRRMGLDAPWWSGTLMLVGGLFWIWVISAAIVAVAIFIHAGVSPGAAAKGAALWFVPGLLIVILPTAVACAAGMTFASSLRVGANSPGRLLRIVAYWIPTVALWAMGLAAAMVLIAPEFWVSDRAMPALAATAVSVWMAFRGPRDRPKFIRADGLALLLHLSGAGLAGILARGLAPTGLEPPLWTYFLGA